MSFIFNAGTKIVCGSAGKPVLNAVSILRRDMSKVFTGGAVCENEIVLENHASADDESYEISVGGRVTVRAGGDLGFVYALLYISENYLGVKPFWFWMDQKLERKESVLIDEGVTKSKKYAVRFRGWFFNDEVLMLKWKINGDERETWRMAFETLLRCGGNMTIPGTDKMSRKNRQLAADMGLWITHHHAEPLGAEMFARRYTGVDASYTKHPEMFYELWDEAAREQKDYKVVWNLCFRGQGDKPFWGDDKSGKFDTPEKRGALISEVIAKQRDLVKKYVQNPVFCTNLYGEIMELYKDGYINLDDDIIKVRADNGYGKMVTRRRDSHNVRVSSMPEKDGGSQGIYYHVSFYDLQAANHITMLPNSVDFVNRELNAVLENNGGAFWIINCSNVKPHVYFLDAVRKKWEGKNISDETHSAEFASDYFGADENIRRAFKEYPNVMLRFGGNEDEKAGEQFYTENARVLAHSLIRADFGGAGGLKWIADGTLFEQAKTLLNICLNGMGALERYFDMCRSISGGLSASVKPLFDETVFLQAKIHYYCARGMIALCKSVIEFGEKNYKDAFLFAGDSAALYDTANNEMRASENGVWRGFYSNDCFADIKHSAYMARKAMGTIREYGDNARHDTWQRDAAYSEEDRDVFLLLLTDNHMTDDELYKEMREK